MLLFGKSFYKLNTPILFEGDSNTDPNYSLWGWAKRALVHAGARYYLPPSGNFANAGGMITGSGGGDMDDSISAVTAKITALKAKFGKCIVWFQIGTNNGTNITADLVVLANVVAAYRAAGAKVYANTCPNFGVTNNGYQNTLNNWIKTKGNVDGYVDVNLFIDATASGDGTHYNEIGQNLVGRAVGAYLKNLAVKPDIYSITNSLTDGSFSGTGGTNGTGSSGQVATGWTVQRNIGDGTVVCSKSTLNGKTAQTLTVNGGTSGAFIVMSKSQSGITTNIGDVIDGFVTLKIDSATDNSSINHLGIEISGGVFPTNVNGTIYNNSNWSEPTIWRVYPVTKTASGTGIYTSISIQVNAGKTATITVADMRTFKVETA